MLMIRLFENAYVIKNFSGKPIILTEKFLKTLGQRTALYVAQLQYQKILYHKIINVRFVSSLKANHIN